jgi:hypothetical protein
LIIKDFIYASYKQITTAVPVRHFFPIGSTEYEDLADDYFKAYVPQVDENEQMMKLINREKTPEKLSIYTKVAETRAKPENIKKKSKSVSRKQKRKKNDSNLLPKSKKKDPFEEMQLEMYKKVISKKIPVLTNARPVSNNTLLTRRQLTEEKIIENIRRYGDPADRIDYTGLCVVDESLYYEELAKLRGSNSII